MLREVALRSALQDARDRRQRELDETQERARALRRRLRELTDRSLALGTVHGRFTPPEPTTPAEPAVAEPPPPRADPVPTPSPADPLPAPTFTLPPPKREEGHEKLALTLLGRHPDGFTVGQMKEILDELEGRAHTYDAAWALANNLLRTRVLEVAGTRAGPSGPIRVLRVGRTTMAGAV